MGILQGKKIILGVTASISAYKSPMILRELIKHGAEVTVIMSNDAQNFVSPLVLSNLSGKNVIIDQFDTNLNNNGAWHVKLANDCDIMLIAPLSANTLSKIANGLCDNALLTVLYSLPIGFSFDNQKSVPVVLAPAMDFDMWHHPILKRNVAKLEDIGYKVIEPEEGELASGLIGKGRLPEISVIIEEVIKSLNLSESNLGNIVEPNKSNIIEVVIDNSIDENTPLKIEIIEEVNIEEAVAKDNLNNNIDNTLDNNINNKIDDIKSKIQKLEAKLKIDNLTKNTNAANTLNLISSRVQEYLNKPIESINETIENRKFDVELELELLKKKV